jgi:hypothetical protein
MVLAADYPLLDVFWTTLIIFGWVLWFFLLFRVYSDLFSRRDIGGGAKTLWVVFTLFLPFVGVLAYLIAEGRSMAERSEYAVRQQQAANEEYIRSVAADADQTQMAKAQSLLDSGAINAEEFDRMVHGASVQPTAR